MRAGRRFLGLVRWGGKSTVGAGACAPRRRISCGQTTLSITQNARKTLRRTRRVARPMNSVWTIAVTMTRKTLGFSSESALLTTLVRRC